jgi:hypothetical protein
MSALVLMLSNRSVCKSYYLNLAFIGLKDCFGSTERCIVGYTHCYKETVEMTLNPLLPTTELTQL